jgi:hypothetical protein
MTGQMTNSLIISSQTTSTPVHSTLSSTGLNRLQEVLRTKTGFEHGHTRHEFKAGGLFPDADALKTKLREALVQPNRGITHFYHKAGFCQSLAKRSEFEIGTLLVICVNAVWLSIDIDYNKETTLQTQSLIFVLAEYFFCVFFTVELFVRFMAVESKVTVFKDRWFAFDLGLVSCSIFESIVMPIVVQFSTVDTLPGNSGLLRVVRLLRLTRMGRLARMLRAMPELIILVKGLMAASRSAFFTFVLLLSVIYAFAICFVSLPVAQAWAKSTLTQCHCL